MRPFAFIKDLSSDGSRVVSIIGPLCSAVFWVAKLFFGTTLMLDDWSWAWGFAPITIWLAIAYFRRWHSYRTLSSEKENIQTELNDERKKNLPDILAEIHTIITGEADNNQKASCLMNVKVTNKGAPTALDKWSVTIKTPDGNKYSCQLQTLKGWKFHFENQTLELDQEDAIYEKTIKPIPRGGFERGWILGILPIPRALILPKGTEFTLEFEDVMGNRNSVSVFPDEPTDELKYYPDGRGLKMKPISKDTNNTSDK